MACAFYVPGVTSKTPLCPCWVESPHGISSFWAKGDPTTFIWELKGSKKNAEYQGRCSLWSAHPGRPGTCSWLVFSEGYSSFYFFEIKQAGFKLSGVLLPQPSIMLGLQACRTTTGPRLLYFRSRPQHAHKGEHRQRMGRTSRAERLMAAGES